MLSHTNGEVCRPLASRFQTPIPPLNQTNKPERDQQYFKKRPMFYQKRASIRFPELIPPLTKPNIPSKRDQYLINKRPIFDE